MKTKLFLLTILAMITSSINVQSQPANPNKKILVIYFSHSGNTTEIARQIKDATKADIFAVESVKAYPTEYNAVVEQAKKEIAANHKPEIKGKVENIAQYDVIFVGSPCWWSTIAPPVATFLSSYDLSGKTIIPFMTHEGSQMGHSISDIKKLCPKSTVLEGLPIRGGSVKQAEKEVKKWLQNIKMIN